MIHLFSTIHAMKTVLISCLISKNAVNAFHVVSPVKIGRQFSTIRTGVTKGIVSPLLTVPSSIRRPEYAINGKPGKGSSDVKIYSPSDIPKLRRAARLARKMLEFANSQVRPGITTDEIDRLTHDEIVRNGAYPSPLNYCNFPKSICTSVNDVVCHGIPDSTVLKDGDIISIDVSLFIDGFHGDNCGTVVCGESNERLERLIAVTKESVDRAIKMCKPGNCISEIGRVIQGVAASNKYNVVQEFCGHGTGSLLHMPPFVLHYPNTERLALRPGMVFTIEPILVEGSRRIGVWPDGWTAHSFDGGWSAQIEHEVLITDHGVEVLTLLE